MKVHVYCPGFCYLCRSMQMRCRRGRVNWLIDPTVMEFGSVSLLITTTTILTIFDQKPNGYDVSSLLNRIFKKKFTRMYESKLSVYCCVSVKHGASYFLTVVRWSGRMFPCHIKA